MPLYDFRCPAGHKTELFVKLEDFHIQQFCFCQAPMDRVVSAPFVAPDIRGYTSPIDGRWIGSRKARREDLRRNGCVEWEPGLKEEGERRRKRSDELMEKFIDETVEKTIHEMPARKRERLAGELEAGVDAQVVRI